MVTDLMLMLTPTSMVIFMLVVSRLSGMIAAAPFFSTIPAPMHAKALLVALAGFIMYPVVAAQTGAITSTVLDMPALIILIAKEFAIGAVIGFCANIIFAGVQMAGNILSMQMGLSISSVLDPITQENIPVLGQFYMFIASLTFIFINGHLWLFSSVYNSYKVVPINYDFIFTGPLVERIISFTSQIFTIAFELIVPIYAVLIITAMVLGLMSKAMPHMNVFMVALPIKIYIGLALMCLFTVQIATYLAAIMETLLKAVDGIFL